MVMANSISMIKSEKIFEKVFEPAIYHNDVNPTNYSAVIQILRELAKLFRWLEFTVLQQTMSQLAIHSARFCPVHHRKVVVSRLAIT